MRQIYQFGTDKISNECQIAIIKNTCIFIYIEKFIWHRTVLFVIKLAACDKISKYFTVQQEKVYIKNTSKYRQNSDQLYLYI